jgi:hypothetical protein
MQIVLKFKEEDDDTRLNYIVKHWQSIGKKIPPGYKDRVRRAELLFYYHPVYDPVEQRIVYFSRYSCDDEANGHHLPVATADELSILGGESDILSNAPNNYAGGVADVCEGRVSRIDFSAIQPVLPWEVPAVAALSHRIPQASQKSASWGLRRNLSNILRDSGVVAAAPSRGTSAVFGGAQKMRPAASSFQASPSGPVSLMASSGQSLSAKLGRPANGTTESVLARRATVPNISSKAMESETINLQRSKLFRTSTSAIPAVVQEPCGSIAPGFKPIPMTEEARRVSQDIFDLVSDDDCSRFSDKESVASKVDDSIIFSFHSNQSTFAELVEDHEECSRSIGRSPLAVVSDSRLNELEFNYNSGDDSPFRYSSKVRIASTFTAKIDCTIDSDPKIDSADVRLKSLDVGMWTPPVNRDVSNSSFIDCSQTVKPLLEIMESDSNGGNTCDENVMIIKSVIEEVSVDNTTSISVSSSFNRDVSDVCAPESSGDVNDLLLSRPGVLGDSSLSNKRKLSEISRIQSVIISADPRGSKRKKTGKTMTVASIKSFFIPTKI